ncbi:response regulator [Paenibacillus sp. Y412MC10]|uniref:response regulator n=1 Tax=Geobacillus sp. (strain Y412MC10) TaxID=481743 RepID=UPI0016426024|nr:response regulator [Paenibacillus sp. Y412MC10]
MYSVLLVDDEAIALEGLKMLSDWEGLGFQICGACDDGEDALSLIMDTLPDLVVTDIRMPGIDGLELIRRVRSMEHYDPIFVVLSGYSDFEYARTALRYGVRFYMLKPVIEPEWDAIIATIVNELDAKSRTREQEEATSKQVLAIALSRMLRGDLTEVDGDIAHLMDQMNQQATGWRYIHIEGLTCEGTEICRSLSQSGHALYVDMYCNQAGLIVDTARKPLELARRVHEELLKHGLDCSVSVGPSVQTLHDLPESYMRAAKASLQHFFRSEGGGVIDGDPNSSLEMSYVLPPSLVLDELLIAVERSQEQKVCDMLHQLFETFKDNKTAPEVAYMASIQIVMKSIDLLREFGGTTDLWRDVFHFLKTKPGSVAALKQSLHTFLELCMGTVKHYKEMNSEHPLVQIERYLQENFHQNLTIKKIAERFFINPVYLGQAFIKKNGVGILEYIHDLRIAEAKRRLCDTEETVRVIAEDLGYVHYHHFLREFEKRTAHKPVAYRKRYQPGDRLGISAP